MTDYNIHDDFMNLSNEIYEPLYQLLQRTGRDTAQQEAEEGIHGLMGFFHEHDRNNLERIGIDGWMDDTENPDRAAVRRDKIQDMTHELKNIIEQHKIYHNEPVTAQPITDMLVRRFGIRARGIKKPKKHTRHRTRRNGLKHKGTKHKGTKHKGTNHKGTKHKGTNHKHSKH